METDLYKVMQKLKADKSSNNTRDIRYLGTISMDENGKNGSVSITKDVIAMIDVSDDGKITLKYYDENQELIAGLGSDGELIPSNKYMYDDLNFLDQIESLDLEDGISLAELDNELNEVSKLLGIAKSDILSMSKIELDTVVKQKDSDSLILSDKKFSSFEKDKQDEHNTDTLDNISSKQTINLDTKVTDKLTMADVLGVESGSELLVVNSNIIQDNDNSTRFSCVIKNPNGKVNRADMLEQIGGKDSSKNIYATNRDGSKVNQKVTQSSFQINSPTVKNGIISIRQGDLNHTEVFYGQMDKTSHNDAFVQPLETKEMYPVTSKVREEFSQNKGEYNVSDKMDEIKRHEEECCKNLSLDEADGNPYTGHGHSKDAAEIILADENVGNMIDDIYTFNEVEERFNSMQEKYPDCDFDQLVQYTKDELALEAEQMHGHDLSH